MSTQHTGHRLQIVLALLILAAGAVVAVITARRPAANPVGAPSIDYADQASWLCRPGRADSCAADLSATAIAADGATTRLPSPPAGTPPIDCFYVYPTVSRDRHENAPLALTPAEADVARMQAARFRTACRVFAPLYRQLTLATLIANGLRSRIGQRDIGDRELAYADVRDAWRYYLQNDNAGRGVVLIGHSQGARVLKRLLQEEIEFKDTQRLLVSAMLLGNGVIVPRGRSAGGDFQQLPLCESATQFGCVVAYSAFRAGAPPDEADYPAKSGQPGHYGINPGSEYELACTNPAALGGGAAPLDAFFPASLATPETPWAIPPVPISTPFVTLPGLLTGACVHDAHRSYLAISMHDAAGDRRRGDINGDVRVHGHVLRGWGLHVIDMNLALGDLVRLAASQGAAYLKAQ